jgi:hypothetical protein
VRVTPHAGADAAREWLHEKEKVPPAPCGIPTPNEESSASLRFFKADPILLKNSAATLGILLRQSLFRAAAFASLLAT